LQIDDEMDILLDPAGRKLILETLHAEFGLYYVGALPS
jgi:hypothetical protein